MDPTQHYDLQEHGVCILKNVFSLQEIEQFKQLCIQHDYKRVKTELLHNELLKQKIQGVLQNHDYQFQDYIWVIEKSSVHTCHRDNNGDFFTPFNISNADIIYFGLYIQTSFGNHILLTA